MKSVNAQRMYYGVTHPVSLLNVLLDPDNEFDEIEPETDPKKKKKREKLILATVKNKGKQPIRTRYQGHVTGYQPIRDQDFLIRSVPVLIFVYLSC